MNTENRLAATHSPYLKQHSANPVAWQPWDETALERAKREQKPIFLSIGYSTCYWCHVMEEDSFEHDDVAELLNGSFVCIKVDREERPDLDSIYMETVVAITGKGGWPMSVFLTPECKPFWGGTFFYRAQFTKLLETIASAWTEDVGRIELQAEQLLEALRDEPVRPRGVDSPASILEGAVRQLSKGFDPLNGGFSSAPKFPPSDVVRLLLASDSVSSSRFELSTGNTPDNGTALRTMAEKTLDGMARGGIRDHVGGGFHRYSTDEKWLVPHFEKMLYDNALLARAYLDGAQHLHRTDYRVAASELFSYLTSELRSPDGAYYAAQDAGEVGREGEYYVWRPDQLDEVLPPEDAAKVKSCFGVTHAGSFEHGASVLHLSTGLGDEEQFWWNSIRIKLLEARRTRPRPHTDTKIIASWNGLTLAAFAHGYRVLQQTDLLVAAEDLAEFVEQRLMDGGTLYRIWSDGERYVPGQLEDYAYVIEGLIELFVSGGDPHWLNLARLLQRRQDELLWDAEEGAYWSSVASDLIKKKKDFLDNATPSPNAVAFENLNRLYYLTGDAGCYEKGRTLLLSLSPHLQRFPGAGSRALLETVTPRRLVVAVDPDMRHPERALWQHFTPNSDIVRVGSAAGSELPPPLHGKAAVSQQPTYYVCDQNGCRAPTIDEGEAIRLVYAGSVVAS